MEEDLYEIEFMYQGNPVILKCNLKEKLKDILNKFVLQVGITDKKSVIFLCLGNLVDEELTLEELLSKTMADFKKIQILVYQSEPDVIIKSKNIICPECKEDIRLKINDYKVNLYDCKNGHEINDILLHEFSDTQNINLSKIICNNCKRADKGSTRDYEFYYCITCKYYLCPFCNKSHDKNHKLINDKQKNSICNEHNDSFIKYCQDCKQNLCFLCVEMHKSHKIELYEDIIPDINMINNEMNNLDEAINLFENNINQIIDKFKLVINNLKIYYQIYKDLVDNFDSTDINKRKYEIYQNINEIKNNIINEIDNINEERNSKRQIEKIMEIHDMMINKNIKEKETVEEDTTKIIICEKCYTIPKITFLTNTKIKIECSECKASLNKDISYFDKFIKFKGDKILSELPTCTFDEEHKCSSIKYCFNCEKYLCEECLKKHIELYKDKHTLITQKIKSNIICKKKGHNEYKFDKYCTQCEDYLCPSCKCEHEDRYYYLGDPDKEKKVKKISEKIMNCEKMVEVEEKNLNVYLEKVYNKIDAIKKMFKDFKERNLKYISLYKLLVSNYDTIKEINNFNIENNILINENFNYETSNLKKTMKFGREENECLESIYNKLCNFYLNKNFITPKKYPEFIITKKFCNKNIKKVLVIDDELIIILLEKENTIYKLIKNSKNEFFIEKVLFKFALKDIYPLKDSYFIFVDYNNNMYIINYNNKEFSIVKTFEKINLFLIDIFNEEKFFTLKNNSDNFIIEYYYEIEISWYRKYQKCESSFIYMKKKIYVISKIFLMILILKLKILKLN